MPAATQANSANYLSEPCTRCGAKELQRKPRTLSNRLVGIYPYVCLHCGNRQIKIRRKLALVVRLFLLLAIPAAAVLFWMHPISLHKGGEDASPNSAEALARARTAAGGLSAYEQMMIKKPRSTLDNATILKLWKANVGTDVILQLIRTSNSDYDVSASSIIELKDAGVNQSIILAMIDASYANR